MFLRGVVTQFWQCQLIFYFKIHTFFHLIYSVTNSTSRNLQRGHPPRNVWIFHSFQKTFIDIVDEISSAETCGICFDDEVQSEAFFGMLSNCNLRFCISCIRRGDKYLNHPEMGGQSIINFQVLLLVLLLSVVLLEYRCSWSFFSSIPTVVVRVPRLFFFFSVCFSLP